MVLVKPNTPRPTSSIENLLLAQSYSFSSSVNPHFLLIFCFLLLISALDCHHISADKSFNGYVISLAHKLQLAHIPRNSSRRPQIKGLPRHPVCFAKVFDGLAAPEHDTADILAHDLVQPPAFLSGFLLRHKKTPPSFISKKEASFQYL